MGSQVDGGGGAQHFFGGGGGGGTQHGSSFSSQEIGSGSHVRGGGGTQHGSGIISQNGSGISLQQVDGGEVRIGTVLIFDFPPQNSQGSP